MRVQSLALLGIMSLSNMQDLHFAWNSILFNLQDLASLGIASPFHLQDLASLEIASPFHQQDLTSLEIASPFHQQDLASHGHVASLCSALFGHPHGNATWPWFSISVSHAHPPSPLSPSL